MKIYVVSQLTYDMDQEEYKHIVAAFQSEVSAARYVEAQYEKQRKDNEGRPFGNRNSSFYNIEECDLLA